MAQCLIDRGAASGIDVGQLLDRVEAAGPWTRAATEVEPLRHQLQHSFLLGRRDTKESNFVRRALARGGGRSADARLAPSAAEMDIDELRVSCGRNLRSHSKAEVKGAHVVDTDPEDDTDPATNERGWRHAVAVVDGVVREQLNQKINIEWLHLGADGVTPNIEKSYMRRILRVYRVERCTGPKGCKGKCL